MLTPTTQASQAANPSPRTKVSPARGGNVRRTKGARRSGDPCGRPRRGCPFKGRANEPFYPADVYPHRRAGEATALARGAIER